jgi:hypothetical protein
MAVRPSSARRRSALTIVGMTAVVHARSPLKGCIDCSITAHVS